LLGESNIPKNPNSNQKILFFRLALDYCVYYTAIDSVQLGFETFVVKDGTRGLSDESIQSAISDMISQGVKVINSNEIVLDSKY